MELVNKINEKELYAARSVADKDGNQIDTTYAKSSDIPSIDGLMAEDKLTIENGKITEYDGTPFAGQGGGESDIVVFNDSNLPTSTELDEAIAANKAICVIYEGRNYMFDRQSGTTYYFYGVEGWSSYLYSLTYNGTKWSRTQQVLAKQSWVNSQGFAKASDIPSVDGLMDESKLTIADGKITEYDGTPFAGGGSGGQSYTSPNETITVDNTNGTLEATKYAMAAIPGEEVEETMTSAYTPHASQVGTLTTIFADNNNSSIATPITYEFPGTNWSFDPTDFVIKIGDTTIPMENISDNPEYVYSSINLKINERATVKDKDIYFLLFEGFSITLSGDNIGKSIEIEMALKNASPLADVYDVTKKYNESSIEKIELQKKLTDEIKEIKIVSSSSEAEGKHDNILYIVTES